MSFFGFMLQSNKSDIEVMDIFKFYNEFVL